MSEWIDTSVSVPAYGQRVLVKDVLVRIGTRYLTDKDGDCWTLEGDGPTSDTYCRSSGVRDVRFWMPLPS